MLTKREENVKGDGETRSHFVLVWLLREHHEQVKSVRILQPPLEFFFVRVRKIMLFHRGGGI